MQTDVVIVAFRSAGHLRACVEPLCGEQDINVIVVDKAAFREAVLKATKPTDHGYRQQDYDRIIKIQ